VTGGPKKIVTWVFKGTDYDFAVQYEMWETAWPKLKPDVLSSLRSFRRIAKEDSGTPAPGGASAVGELIQGEEPQRAQPRAARGAPPRPGEGERGEAREGAARRLDRQARRPDLRDQPPRREEHPQVLRRRQRGARLHGREPRLHRARRVRAAPVVRICKDSDEYRMYQKGSSWNWGDEIVSYKDTATSRSPTAT
jgi:hypothetical protein